MSKWYQSEIASRRVSKLVDLTKSNDEAKADYEHCATELVHALEAVIAELDDRTFDNTLADAQQKMRDFEEFKGTRKPALTNQKLETEAAHNSILMKLRTCGRPPYQAPEACSLATIDALWARMEDAEAKRAVALREELLKSASLTSLSILSLPCILCGISPKQAKELGLMRRSVRGQDHGPRALVR